MQVSVDLAAGTVSGQRILECGLSEKLQSQGTRCFHVLTGHFSCGIAVLLFDGMYQGLVLVQRFRPTVSGGEGGPGGVDEVGGKAVQQVSEDGIVSAIPDGCMKLEVGDDPGVIIWFLELPVALQQGFKTHQVRELPGSGGLSGGLLFEQDSHIVNLDDLLRVHLRYLQAPSDTLEEPFLLEAGQRLPDGGPGDAEALGKRCFS